MRRNLSVGSLSNLRSDPSIMPPTGDDLLPAYAILSRRLLVVIGRTNLCPPNADVDRDRGYLRGE